MEVNRLITQCLIVTLQTNVVIYSMSIFLKLLTDIECKARVDG